MIKIIGHCYLEKHWARYPETEEILKAWFYRFQNFSYKDVDKMIENFPRTTVFNFQVTPSIFLLARLQIDLEVLKILGIETFYKARSGNFITTQTQF